MDVPRRLTRRELTAALAARQGLIERLRVPPAEAIRRLTPLQGQHPPSPFLALAARVDGFTRAGLEAAITAGDVVKTTIMRLTLHLAAAADYPAYAQLTRQARMRAWRKQYAHLDEEQVTAELGAWFREPRGNAEIRERVGAYDGVTTDPWTPVIFARTLLPLIQLPPAGHWDDKRRAGFVLDPRPLPDPADAAAAGARALPRRLRAGEQARRRRVGRRRPARLRGGLGAARDGRLRRRSCTTSPARRCRRPTRRCRRACWPTGTSRCSPTRTASASWPRRCRRSG